jgi:hypothetical protein
MCKHISERESRSKDVDNFFLIGLPIGVTSNQQLFSIFHALQYIWIFPHLLLLLEVVISEKNGLTRARQASCQLIMHAHTTLSGLVEKHVWLPRAFSFHSSISVFRSCFARCLMSWSASHWPMHSISHRLRVKSCSSRYMPRATVRCMQLLLTVTDAVRGKTLH